MITIIVAIDRNNGIGYKNSLLASIPGDLPRFREITMGHCLIMGKMTWESLPKKPLTGRQNIVLTDTARSIDEALGICKPGKEIFIIGGGSVYRQFMPLADRLLVTHMDAEFTADTFFPEISPADWYVTEKEDFLSDDPAQLSFSYTIYLRRR